jgi:hypothetical protein
MLSSLAANLQSSTSGPAFCLLCLFHEITKRLLLALWLLHITSYCVHFGPLYIKRPTLN